MNILQSTRCSKFRPKSHLARTKVLRSLSCSLQHSFFYLR